MATIHLPHLHRDAHHESRLRTLRSALWAVCGATVLLFVAFAAIGGVDPGEAAAATIVAVSLAVLWTAHAWRRLWSDEEGLGSRPDRERRGF